MVPFKSISFFAVGVFLILTGCITEVKKAGNTFRSMHYSWEKIVLSAGDDGRIEYLMDPYDSSIGHHLSIIGFYENGKCSLEVLPFFVNKTKSDTTPSMSDGGFLNAAGTYSLGRDTLIISGKYYSSAYRSLRDSSWNDTLIKQGADFSTRNKSRIYHRNDGYLRGRMKGIKSEEYLGHYDI